MNRIAAFLFVLLHSIGSSPMPVFLKNRAIGLDDLLPAIAAVESSNRVWARSYLGEDFGRGLYGVSKIAFEHWKWFHGDHWVVKQNLGPDCLYNTNVGREVATWYLKWLDKYYDGRPDKLRLVLSAYNQGAAHTDRYGIAEDYVQKVFAGMRK